MKPKKKSNVITIDANQAVKHPMQCAKCFRVCRLSDSGKTWVCTICKHREKANGGQAVSDKLPHVEVHEAMCKSIGDMAKENEALNDRIKRLEEVGDWLSTRVGWGEREQWNKAKEAKP